MSYYEEARARARRRKSPWNLLLIPAVVVPGAFLWKLQFELAAYAHSALYPGQIWRLYDRGIGAILVGVSPVFAAIPVSLYIGNIVVRLIPPARRTLDREAEPYPGTDFRSAQRGLRDVMRYIVPPAVLLTIIGAFLPWYAR